MQRRRHPSVIESLLDEPHRYKFFQAVRVLERWFARAQRERAREVVPAHLRFLNSPSLGFPPSEIAGAMAFDKHGRALTEPEARADAIARGDLTRVEMMPAFFGMLGSQGALPLHYSETLARYESTRRDAGPRAFYDIFSNRAAALFYAAWKKYRLALRHESDDTHHYLPILLSLAGLGHPSLRHRLQEGGGKVYDESIAHYAAAVRQRPVSGTYLQRILSDYFGVAVRVEQFVGKWYDLPPNRRTQLGQPGAVLGVSAMAGDRIWQRDLRMRVWIGPLRKPAFQNFLPGGDCAQALEKLLTLFAGMSFEYEVRLILDRQDVAGSALNDKSGVNLGWNAFLSTEEADGHRDDACYELHTIH